MFKYGPYALAGTAFVVVIFAAMSISRSSISTISLTNKEQLKSVLPRPDSSTPPPCFRPTRACVPHLTRRAACSPLPRSPPLPPSPCLASPTLPYLPDTSDREIRANAGSDVRNMC